MKVLYVEDNDDNIFMLRNRLRRAGYEVVVAMDGVQGVAAAAAEKPDVILMDLSQAHTRHRADLHAMMGDREKALAAGCDDFDTKPVELPRLLKKIRSLTERAAT